MAFVYKSQRKLDLSKKDFCNVGPGLYIGHKSYKVKPTNAPFQYKAGRNVEQERLLTPGPGAYRVRSPFEAMKIEGSGQFIQKNPEEGLFGLIKSNQRQDRVAFSSKVQRFSHKNEKNIIPGPGQYNNNLQITNTKLGSIHPEGQQIGFVRLPNAPSIPSHNFIYGYEETREGELIQQQNPDKIYTGEKLDRVGPGQYQVLSAFEGLRKGPNFHQSSSQRILQKVGKNQNLGPGTYLSNPKPAEPLYKTSKSSVFVSNVPKSAYSKVRNNPNIEENDLPGPGYYYNQKSQFNIQPKFVPENQQFFGSNSQRFPNRPATQDIGPGSYHNRNEFKKISRANNKVGFSSTNFRFNASKNTSKEVPGPGAYENKEITNVITDKVWGKNGIFGTTQNRFHQNKVKKIPPGPGSYDSQDCVKILDHKQQETNAKKQNAIFLSGSMRGLKKIPLDVQNAKFQGQEHGTIENAIKKKIIRMIDPLSANIRLQKKFTDIGFDSKTKRFQTQILKDRSNIIGPGYYDANGDFNPQSLSGKGNALVYKDLRFRESTSNIPGPGQYANLANGWNKKTYNMLFSPS